jgi:oxygen-independent coproporphyrinogen III oxidase
MEHSLGIYISVPFCRAKCSFCNFASGAFALERLDGYVDRLCAEIHAARPDAAAVGGVVPGVVDSIYFGGGTPSLLTAAQLERIFAALRGEFTVTADADVTLECAPGQVSGETLEAALRLGMNRVSFGVQSFVDAETAAVGRMHTAAMCTEEIARMRAAGVAEISADLIAGLPQQTAESWERSLAVLLETGVAHASVYMLEVDDESRLGKELIKGGPRYGAAAVPSDEAMTEFYARACTVFEADGLAQYEISNFARAGHASRHNLKYWERAPYLGFGLDAHSMLRADYTAEGRAGSALEAVRFANPDTLEAYVEGAGREVTAVDAGAAFEETLFLGLRRNVGVDLEAVAGQFGRARVNAVRPAMETMAAGGLLAFDNLGDGQRVRLTAQGRMVSNEVFAELLGVEA